jgi:hypothetical protein
MDMYYLSFRIHTVGGGNTPIGVVCHKTLKTKKSKSQIHTSCVHVQEIVISVAFVVVYLMVNMKIKLYSVM